MRRSYSITDVYGLRRRSIWVRVADGLSSKAASRLHSDTAATQPTAAADKQQPSPRTTDTSPALPHKKKWHSFSKWSSVVAFFRHSSAASAAPKAHGSVRQAMPEVPASNAQTTDDDSSASSRVSDSGDALDDGSSIASSVSSQAEEVDMQAEVEPEEEFPFSSATYTNFTDYERWRESRLITHDGHHRLVYEAKPDRYWRVRYMAIYDSFVENAPTGDEEGEGEDEDEEENAAAGTSAGPGRDDASISSAASRKNRQATSHRIFSVLETVCETPEARESLFRFECAYAAQHGFPRPVAPKFHRGWWRQARDRFMARD